VAITFAGILYCNLWPEMDDQCDEPLRESFSAWPEVEGIVRELTRDLKRPMKGSAAFLLNPTVWRRFGCDSARVCGRGEIPIPGGGAEGLAFLRRPELAYPPGAGEPSSDHAQTAANQAAAG